MFSTILQNFPIFVFFNPHPVLLFRCRWWDFDWWSWRMRVMLVLMLLSKFQLMQLALSIHLVVSYQLFFGKIIWQCLWMLTSDIYFESHPVSKVSVNLKRMLGSLMARSNDVVINVHVLTDDDGKSWVEDTILNVIGRHLTEGIVFGFENNNVTLQRKYLGGEVYQEMLLFKFFSQMLTSSPAPLTESYWIQWRSSLGKIVWAVKQAQKLVQVDALDLSLSF